MKEVYKDDMLELYTHPSFRGYANTYSFVVLHRFKDKIYRRHMMLPNYPGDIPNEKLLDFVKEFDKISFKSGLLPYEIYQAAIDYIERY